MSVPLIRWDAPGPYTVAFSTRLGGVSEGSFESLNLGRRTRDNPENVDENRRRLCASVGVEPELLALNRQVHGTTVNRAEPGDRTKDGDGLWTDEAGVPMLAFSADCLPIAVVRVNSSPGLALLHAGRLGLLAGIVQAGASALDGRLAAIVGPGIGPCCYEVGEDILAAYRARFGWTSCAAATSTCGQRPNACSTKQASTLSNGSTCARPAMPTASSPIDATERSRDGRE